MTNGILSKELKNLIPVLRVSSPAQYQTSYKSLDNVSPINLVKNLTFQISTICYLLVNLTNLSETFTIIIWWIQKLTTLS